VKQASRLILLDHGAGGRLSRELVEGLILPRFGHRALARLDDSAVLDLAAQGRVALTTDSYTVTPLFFPGGDIGRLAVCGTVNDLAMAGARPLYLTLALIIEEGLDLAELERALDSAREAAREAGVEVVAGDTKVVPRGAADKLFINTAGLGVVPPGVEVSSAKARPGDAVLLSGSVGDHGLTILTQRAGTRLDSSLRSDTAPLAGLVEALIASGAELHSLRDPTRGGLAATLNEIALSSGVGLSVKEGAIPVKAEVEAACELFGLDPLFQANEGKLVALVRGDGAERALAALRGHPLGQEAAIIGRAGEERPGRVILETRVGGRRFLDLPAGEPTVRIC